MKEVLETHSQHFTRMWEGFIGSKETPRLECNAACHCVVFALSIMRAICVFYIATHLIISTPLTLNSNMYAVFPRWSSCCADADAVPSSTWGWSASWQTFHLPNWQPSICLVLYNHTAFYNNECMLFLKC